jgi:hypothetical protein
MLPDFSRRNETMIPTDLVIAQLVPELHSTLTIGVGGVLAIGVVVALLAVLVLGAIRELRAENAHSDERDGHRQMERQRHARRAA